MRHLCGYCQQSMVNGDVSVCECGKFNHLSCQRKNKHGCRDCMQEDLFKKTKNNRNQNEFDFSGFNKKEHLEKYQEKQQKVPVLLERNSSAKKKTHQDKLKKDLMDKLESLNVKKNFNISKDNAKRNKTVKKFFEIFINYLTKEDHLNNHIEKNFQQYTLSEQFQLVYEKVTLIEQTIYKEGNFNIHKNSVYVNKVKLLLQSLSDKNDELISDILNNAIQVSSLVQFTQNDLMSKELRNKRETQKKEAWDSRKLEQEQKPLNIRESEVVA